MFKKIIITLIATLLSVQFVYATVSAPVNGVTAGGNSDSIWVRIVKITNSPGNTGTIEPKKIDSPVSGTVKVHVAVSYTTDKISSIAKTSLLITNESKNTVAGFPVEETVKKGSFDYKWIGNTITMNVDIYEFDWDTSALPSGKYMLTATSYYTPVGSTTQKTEDSDPQSAYIIGNTDLDKDLKQRLSELEIIVLLPSERSAQDMFIKPISNNPNASRPLIFSTAEVKSVFNKPPGNTTSQIDLGLSMTFDSEREELATITSGISQTTLNHYGKGDNTYYVTARAWKTGEFCRTQIGELM